MTEDVIHVFQSLNSILQVFKSSIYSVLDRAILANLQHRPLKLGRLIHVVLQEAHLWNRYKQLCSHGNSLFSSPHPLDFKMLVIFSSKNIKPGHKLKLTHLYICLLDHAYQVPLANIKIECQRCQKSVLLGRSGTQYVAMVTKLSSLSYGAHFVESYGKKYKLAEISHFDQIWLGRWHQHLANLHILTT